MKNLSEVVSKLQDENNIMQIRFSSLRADWEHSMVAMSDRNMREIEKEKEQRIALAERDDRILMFEDTLFHLRSQISHDGAQAAEHESKAVASPAVHQAPPNEFLLPAPQSRNSSCTSPMHSGCDLASTALVSFTHQ